MAGDQAGHGLLILRRSTDPHLHLAPNPEPAAPWSVVELDSGGADLDQATRLEGPRELLQGRAAGVSQEDLGQGLTLGVVRRLVDVEQEVPWRTGLVVVVPANEHHALAGQRDLSCAPVLDRPGHREHARAVGRAPSGSAPDAPARADHL